MSLLWSAEGNGRLRLGGHQKSDPQVATALVWLIASYLPVET